MNFTGLIFGVIIVALGLWAINKLFAQYIPPPFLEVINGVVVVLVVLVLLAWFLGYAGFNTGLPVYQK